MSQKNRESVNDCCSPSRVNGLISETTRFDEEFNKLVTPSMMLKYTLFMH